MLRSLRRSRDSTAGPSLPPARYAGAYRDALYGDATITLENGSLVLRFSHSPAFVGDLEHWQYDTFKTHWRTPHLEDAFVTFGLNPDGSIAQFKMAAVSPHGRLAGLTVPALLLHGSGDAVIPTTETQWLAKDVPLQALKNVLISPALGHVDVDTKVTVFQKWDLVHFMAQIIDREGQLRR